MNFTKSLSAVAVSTLLVSGMATSAAYAGSRDADGDGIPTRWEKSHGMNPFRAADAKRDFDRDGLSSLREYRLGTRIRDEDSDNDGYDDGDEVKDGFRSTSALDADTNSDGILDGDDDADRDGVDNEDEDDAAERCGVDDDDTDRDDVADEDENDFGLKVRDGDSDGNGIPDGDETDEDGQAHEDDDDDDTDACDGDFDDDGKDDEDHGDLLGVIDSYDAATGVLVVTGATGLSVTGVVTEDTEIEFEEAEEEDSESDDDADEDTEEDSEDGSESEAESEDREGTTADLLPGTQVAELEFDDEDGTIEEIEIYQTIA